MTEGQGWPTVGRGRRDAPSTRRCDLRSCRRHYEGLARSSCRCHRCRRQRARGRGPSEVRSWAWTVRHWARSAIVRADVDAPATSGLPVGASLSSGRRARSIGAVARGRRERVDDPRCHLKWNGFCVLANGLKHGDTRVVGGCPASTSLRSSRAASKASSVRLVRSTVPAATASARSRVPPSSPGQSRTITPACRTAAASSREVTSSSCVTLSPTDCRRLSHDHCMTG